MDKYKMLSIFSTIMAIILFVLMSVNVAIVYCNNQKYEGSSASANVAIIVAIRYIIIILATLINSYRLWKKSERN
ncbi:hypothetical protein NBE98_10980 [Clostridium swellfunianum]|uniref:hypothetical protein n=1 Tax=Clostridium swellfunianum TaxID=1367462 RepID=UPI00202DC8F9|nr:hypothetical protein [Clostridium swellfunianum]MCM0648897.1 hypothetical protein [Clostridium swellfunianum]